MIQSPQHTEPCRSTKAGRAAVARTGAVREIAARTVGLFEISACTIVLCVFVTCFLCVSVGRFAVAQNVPDRTPDRTDTVDAGSALLLGSVVLTSVDESVVIPAPPDDSLPDSLTTEGMQVLTAYILQSLTERGRLMATARLDSIRSSPGGAGWDVYISIEPGPVISLSGVVLSGDVNTRPRTAALLAGIRLGERAGRVPLDRVQTAVRGSGLFRTVGEPYYEILSDSTARLSIPVTPAPPGSFDVTIGVLPGSDPDGGAELVGNGSIDLNNAFGAGRRFDLLLDRRPGQTSHVNAGASDPFVAGYPVRLDLRFDGLQQDSTWSKRTWSAAAAYRFGFSLDDLEVGVRYSREVTQPGQAGLGISGGTQRIARSNASFWGVELALRRVDDPVSPRSGLIVESVLERGSRTSRRRVVQAATDTGTNAGTDTIRVATSDRRERMSVRLRGHVPIGSTLSFVTGGDVSILAADDVDESDLFRLGGASSLRGYDEDRFRGTTVARGLVEVRSWFEQRSYAAAFFDLGYVSLPEIRDRPGTSGWHPGFGVAVQFTAPVGLMNVSYALNSSGGVRDGRIHVGVRFGL